MSTPDVGLRQRVEALIPNECWVLRTNTANGPVCTDLTGGGFANGAKWTENMCCLPCRLRAAICPLDATQEDA